MKREKAVDDRDQTVRINQLRDRIPFRWSDGNDEPEPCSIFAIEHPGDRLSVKVYCDAAHPDSDGKYRTAIIAIKKRLAQTMDGETLCRRLAEGFLRSAARGYHVGVLPEPDPPPVWIA
jgi:hypothetical protein